MPKRCKTMMTHAVNDRLIDESPFSSIKLTGGVNRERDFFVAAATYQSVLSACPDCDWELVLSLGRIGGLRRCEITTLKWSDVLWDSNRLRIDSPKTGLRFCPMFPGLRSILESGFEHSAESSVYCVRFRQGQNLGTQINRIIQQAGVTPWPKTFVNLRASRRTELEEMFPSHVVNRWL